MQIIEKAFTESLLLRNCKGVLKDFQTNFETFFKVFVAIRHLSITE